MRICALVIRIIRQFLHDKRSLALMFVAPIFILWFMSLIFDGEVYTPKLGTLDIPERFAEALEEQGAELVQYASEEESERSLEKQEIDAVLRFDGFAPTVRLEGSDPSVNRSVLMLLQNAMKSAAPQAMPELNIEYLHGSSEMTAFDNFGPVLVGVFSFFFVFLLSGISFLRERTGGTLERLLAAPIRRAEIVVGYLTGFGLFAVVQSVLIVWFAIDVLDLRSAGSFWLVLTVTLALAATALTLGTFLSAYASNELQMVQFIPLVIVPQIFFSGLFHLDTIVDWLRPVCYIMPMYYGADALQDVMVRGGGWSEIAPNVYVLLGFSFLLAAANTLVLRKHRKI